MANESGILVLGEVADGALAGITGEMLGAARRIAGKLGGSVSLALAGGGVAGLAQEAIAQGADRVYVADSPELQEYVPDRWLPLLQQILQQANPAVILMGQTSNGRDLAPHLAFRLGTAVAMDTIELDAEDGKLLMTRPCFGGNAREVVTIGTMPQIATVRAKSQDPIVPDASRQGEITTVSPSVDAALVKEKVVERTKAAAEGLRLEDADIIVSGGRGLGGPEGFQLVEQLAGVLGAAVGASRAACDLGWYPPSQQVGLTGKTVSPDLYLAIAISGASQHLAGMAGSKNVVAINKDPDSNMVKGARFAVIGDYKQVVPALIEAVKKLKA
ncbi:MAG: electron transfer flavoprotein subunit alpha/FixB family protein [Dehalococcoidia bacterium]